MSKSYDLSTSTKWANLADGDHVVKLRARGALYGSSSFSNSVTVTKAAIVYTDCLTFTGKTNEFTLKADYKAWDGMLEWSTDHNTWTTLTWTEAMQSVGKKLYLRGKGNTTFYNNDYSKAVRWTLSEKADCTGNIQTLLDWENPPTSISKSHCYESMFNSCTNLTTAPELSATTLAPYCYRSMFDGCTNLTSAPELPATTLAERCYWSMFQWCDNLTSAPELPVTTLKVHCYSNMFGYCKSLTTAPKLLPATTLAEGCYDYMFYNCANLATAPELPATTLAKDCYYKMFDSCTKLKVNATSGNKIFRCPSNIPNFAVNDMFASTGGTFTGTPTAGTTYYWTE